MTTCGIPTVTCVLLLVFMAALYGSTHAKNDIFQVGSHDLETLSAGDIEAILSRIRRATQQAPQRSPPRAPARSVVLGRKPTGNNRGPQGRIDDTTKTENDSNVIGRRPGNRKKETQKKKTPRPVRPFSAGKGKMPLGVNRKTLAFAEKIGSANSQFASKILKAVYPKIQSNTVLSPLSIHTALSMLLLGAKRATEKELVSALGLRQAGVKKAQIHKGYLALLSSLDQVHENVILDTANAVFVKPNIPIEAAFKEGLAQMYRAMFDNFDFSSPAGPEAPINEWVSNVTHNKINDLLSPGMVTPLTSLVLVNAIFFNASWDKPFSLSMTSKKPFNTLSEGVKDVDTMAITNSFSYVNNMGAEVIELPFRGDRMAMYIILPSNSSSVDQLIEELSNAKKYGPDAADRIFRNMEPAVLYLELPKFKIESSSLKLKAPLQSLGIKKAFTDEADLSGISDVGLSVDDVIHKAFIDVNERGTEASAATAVLISRRSQVIMKSKEVKVDRPFVFAIRDKPTKAVLFVGAYVGPTN